MRTHLIHTFLPLLLALWLTLAMRDSITRTRYGFATLEWGVNVSLAVRSAAVSVNERLEAIWIHFLSTTSKGDSHA
jgi:hypothetical protein